MAPTPVLESAKLAEPTADGVPIVYRGVLALPSEVVEIAIWPALLAALGLATLVIVARILWPAGIVWASGQVWSRPSCPTGVEREAEALAGGEVRQSEALVGQHRAGRGAQVIVP